MAKQMVNTENAKTEASASALEKVLNPGREKTVQAPITPEEFDGSAGPTQGRVLPSGKEAAVYSDEQAADPALQAKVAQPNPDYFSVPRNPKIVQEMSSAASGAEGLDKLLGVQAAAGQRTLEKSYDIKDGGKGNVLVTDGEGNIGFANKRRPSEAAVPIPGARRPETTRDAVIKDPNNPDQYIKTRTSTRDKGVVGVVSNPEELAQKRGASYAQEKAKYTMYDVVENTGQGPVTRKASAYEIAQNNDKDPGRFMPASSGQKVINQKTFIADIHGATNSLRASIDRMPELTPDTAAQVAMVMKSSNPRSAWDSWFKAGASDTLTPEQIDYVTDLVQLQENAMAMRSVLGAGQGSDELRAAIRATVPGASTPSKAYAYSQLDKLEDQLNRLSRGVSVNAKLAPEQDRVQTVGKPAAAGQPVAAPAKPGKIGRFHVTVEQPKGE
jgi:hypothetical protein